MTKTFSYAVMGNIYRVVANVAFVWDDPLRLDGWGRPSNGQLGRTIDPTNRTIFLVLRAPVTGNLQGWSMVLYNYVGHARYGWIDNDYLRSIDYDDDDG